MLHVLQLMLLVQQHLLFAQQLMLLAQQYKYSAVQKIIIIRQTTTAHTGGLSTVHTVL